MFKGIWSLEFAGRDKETDEMIQKAIENPSDFVLKPQKEGGGNNFWEDEVKYKLMHFDEDPELRSYLLMEKIKSPIIPAVHITMGEMKVVDSLSELGINSVIFTRNTADGRNELIENKLIGTLLRTKASSELEGGVSAGFSVIDDLLIVPMKTLVEKAKDLPHGRLHASVNLPVQ